MNDVNGSLKGLWAVHQTGVGDQMNHHVQAEWYDPQQRMESPDGKFVFEEKISEKAVRGLVGRAHRVHTGCLSIPFTSDCEGRVGQRTEKGPDV